MIDVQDHEARYRVDAPGWHGIAVRVDGWPQRWEPATYYAEDEDGNEVECEDPYEGEWIDDTEPGMVNVVMVGDDHRHLVDAASLVRIAEEDYCRECGQIGCGWS